MRLLCRYAGGLACLVTALALVACGGGPGTQPEPKQIGNITFQEGEKVRTIPLSDKFTGTDLTYSAESSNVRVATATVDNEADTLTITAIGAGTATITVTAKNSQGEAKQPPFTVTVPPPASEEATPTVRTGAITSVPVAQGGAQAVTLSTVFTGANLSYTVLSSDTAVATASESNGTLTISGVSIGSATVTVTATNAAGSSPAHAIAVTVTVPPPASEEEAPTVRTGAITSVPVAQGGTQTVTLSTVFDGANLTYDVSSGAGTVATASESGGTLTITGVSIGPATITIVATNDAGTVTHQIAVTVTARVTTPQPSATCKYPSAVRVTIDLGRTKSCTIPKLHTLNPDSSGVSVRRDLSDKTGTVWLVRAETKGTHHITVHDGVGKPVTGKITVVVPNSLPYRNDTEDRDPITLEASGNHEPETLEVASPTTLHGYFTDPDEGDTAPFIYRIVDQPEWVLIETQDGFLVTDFDATDEGRIKSSTTELHMEVLNAMKAGEEGQFTVSLVASDGSDESELPLVLRFRAAAALLPQMMDYTSEQTESGALGKTALKVGPRRGVPHNLTFNQSGTVAGFKFVADATLNTSRLPSESVTGTAALFYKTGSATRNADGLLPKHGDTDWASGYHYYVLESSSAIEEPRWDWGTQTEPPKITFKLKDSGRSGSITISYYVVYGTSADTAVAATSATRIGSKSLSVTVLTCSSPPDPISDCP